MASARTPTITEANDQRVCKTKWDSVVEDTLFGVVLKETNRKTTFCFGGGVTYLEQTPSSTPTRGVSNPIADCRATDFRAMAMARTMILALVVVCCKGDLFCWGCSERHRKEATCDCYLFTDRYMFSYGFILGMSCTHLCMRVSNCV